MDRFQFASARPLLGRGIVVGFAVAVCQSLCAFGVADGQSLTPDSAEVKKAVERGVAFLSADEQSSHGAAALVGLALYKAGHRNGPLVDAAVVAVRSDAANKVQPPEIYSHALAILLLCERDGEGDRRLVRSLVDSLLDRQKRGGGFGYDLRDMGDTSMTQFAMLALWEADAIGVATPQPAWESACNWLLRTQDPGGGWGYQGRDPGNFNLIPQEEVRHSLASGGLASLYLCGDYFGLAARPAKVAPIQKVAFRLPDDKPERRNARQPLTVSAPLFDKACSSGEAWFGENETLTPDHSTHYFLYSYERYQTFRARHEGRAEPESPDWYHDAAQYLIQTQRNDGSWQSSWPNFADTAFAILFLTRAAKQSVERADARRKPVD